MIYTKFSEKLGPIVRWVLLTMLVFVTIFIVASATSSDADIEELGSVSVLPVHVSTEAPVVTEAPKLADPVTFPELTYIALFDIDACNLYIDEVRVAVSKVEAAIESEKYTDQAEGIMRQEVTRLYSIIAYTEADIRHYTTQEQEHYYAAKVWQFFKQRGYNDAVTSAIIGNMMIETSGGTLELRPEIYSSGKGFYGLCQWSLYYKPFMSGKTFEEQLEYLDSDMQKEFESFGFCYKRGFTYEDFLAMEDPAQAALAFAKVYERCGSGSYGLRKQAANRAYNYFTVGTEYVTG